MSTLRCCAVLVRSRSFAALVSASSLALLAACGSAEAARDELGWGAPAAVEAGADGRRAPPSLVGDDDTPNAAGDAEACAIQRIPLRDVQRPIDVIMVLDNSVSMALELDAVERSINVDFASILQARGADYRVILLSRHRSAERHQSEDAKTAICVTQPLSTLDDCPAQRPGQSERFFHYDVDIDSNDSLARIVETYAEPGSFPRATGAGWGERLRPGSRKIFLEFTDDDSLTYAREFVNRLVALAPEHFGDDPDRPEFVFHSVIGVAEREPPGTAYAPEEPIVLERCSKSEGLAASSGHTYQTLSRLSGGLRYPLCATGDYGVVFEGIALDGIRRSGLACSFGVPAAPAGKRLDTRHIQLVQGETGDGGTPLTRVGDREECGSDAFYVAGDQLELCPELCERLVESPSTVVSVEFDCNSLLDVR